MTLNPVGLRLRKARANLAAARAAAEAEALKLLTTGVSEAEVARALGVDRMTVRKWQRKR